MATSPTQTFTVKCACGHDKADKAVRADADYGIFSWLAMAVLGVNVRPRAVTYRCGRCMTVFEKTSDRKVLEEHRTPH